MYDLHFFCWVGQSVEINSMVIRFFSLHEGSLKTFLHTIIMGIGYQLSTYALSLEFGGHSKVINICQRLFGVILVEQINGKSANDFSINFGHNGKKSILF